MTVQVDQPRQDHAVGLHHRDPLGPGVRHGLDRVTRTHDDVSVLDRAVGCQHPALQRERLARRRSDQRAACLRARRRRLAGVGDGCHVRGLEGIDVPVRLFRDAVYRCHRCVIAAHARSGCARRRATAARPSSARRPAWPAPTRRRPGTPAPRTAGRGGESPRSRTPRTQPRSSAPPLSPSASGVTSARKSLTAARHSSSRRCSSRLEGCGTSETGTSGTRRPQLDRPLRHAAERDHCLQLRTRRPVIELIAPRQLGRLLEALPLALRPTRMHRVGPRVQAHVRPRQTQLGQQTLHPLAGVSDQAAPGDPLGRTRIGRDTQHARGPVQAAAVEHRPPVEPEVRAAPPDPAPDRRTPRTPPTGRDRTQP